MDTREELNKTVSEMNHIVKDIIKIAEKSNKEEQSKILVLSQLLNKTKDLIDAVEAPKRDLDAALDQQRRYLLLDIEDRIRRSEQDILNRIEYVLKYERKDFGL